VDDGIFRSRLRLSGREVSDRDRDVMAKNYQARFGAMNGALRPTIEISARPEWNMGKIFIPFTSPTK
jgi:hypothetical protein